MKTLDEVIGQLEFGLYDRDVHKYHIENILPHLKDYKNKIRESEKKDEYIEELKETIEKLNNRYYNARDEIAKRIDKEFADSLSLTWEKLTDMVGKPVWLEADSFINYTGWSLVREIRVNKAYFIVCRKENDIYETIEICLLKMDYNKQWKVFYNEHHM